MDESPAVGALRALSIFGPDQAGAYRERGGEWSRWLRSRVDWTDEATGAGGDFRFWGPPSRHQFEWRIRGVITGDTLLEGTHSFCRQHLWGAWGGGYYVDGKTDLPGSSPDWPVRSLIESACTNVPPF